MQEDRAHIVRHTAGAVESGMPPGDDGQQQPGGIRMSIRASRSTSEVPAIGGSHPGFPDDQLYMLKLCLELQLEVLLLTLGSSAVASSRSRCTGDILVAGRPGRAGRPWSRWLAEDLELACALTKDCVEDDIPLPSSMALPRGTDAEAWVESLAARYCAMAAVVAEMLERTDPERHPMAVARLVQTRARCQERLDELHD
jgi:hypothetical protein